MQGSELAGMFSERDYVRKVILKGRFLERDARQGVDVEPGRHRHASGDGGRVHAPDDVEALPASSRSSMPESVVGVVSIGDLVNWIISVQGQTIHQLEHYITGGYPG